MFACHHKKILVNKLCISLTLLIMSLTLNILFVSYSKSNNNSIDALSIALVLTSGVMILTSLLCVCHSYQYGLHFSLTCVCCYDSYSDLDDTPSHSIP